MEQGFEIKVRAILGMDDYDDKEVVILGRVVRWTKDGIEYEADEKHRKLVMDYFGFTEDTKSLSFNGDKEDKNEEWESEDLDREEAKIYRGLAARLNFLSQDSPDLQFPVKGCSQDMAKPKRGSWKRIKKVARWNGLSKMQFRSLTLGGIAMEMDPKLS